MFSIVWFIVVAYIIYKAVRKRNTQGGSGSAPERMQTNTTRRMQADIPQTKQDAKANQGSTMAYLEEKARQDALEHAKEKREEAKRIYQNSGGLRAAERLYEGDSVPAGKRCVVCAYCGAENLLPVTARERYGCYFCREPL